MIPFLDAHVHLNDEAMQLELMARYGVTEAVAFRVVAPLFMT